MHNAGPISIELRHICKEDIPAIVSQANNIEVSRHLLRVPFPYTVNDAEGFLKYAEELDEVKNILRVIQVDGKFAGVISAVEVTEDDETLSVGYWLGQSFWGKGVMTSSLQRIINEVFSCFSQIIRLRLDAFSENVGSQRVAVKCGFSRIGSATLHGRESYRFVLTRNDYNSLERGEPSP